MINRMQIDRWIDRIDMIRELYGVTKGVDERIDVGVPWGFGHVERI